LGLARWTTTAGATTFVSDDADGCSGSGSVSVAYVPPAFGSFSQCVPAAPNTQYYFGLRYKQNGGGSVCSVWFFAGTTCSGSNVATFTWQGISDPFTFWMGDFHTITSPANAGSVQVFCQTNGATAWFDQLYLNASANSY